MPKDHRLTHTTNRSWRTALGLGALILTLAASYGACVEDKDVDTQTWELRDMLGLGPAWFESMDDKERQALEKRLRDEAITQAEDGAWIDLLDDALDPAPLPEAALNSPRRALSELDVRLEAQQRAPLLIGWAAYERSAQGSPVARACPLALDDFDTDDTPIDREDWLLDDAFERPLDAKDPQGPQEIDALERRLGLLRKWVNACAQAVGHAPGAKIDVRRARSIPALVSYWPDGPRLYVNPALLKLWGHLDPAPVRSGWSTVSQPLGFDAYDRCLLETPAYCARCMSPQQAQTSQCSDDLMGDNASQACMVLTETPLGFERYCLNQLIRERNFQLSQCIAQVTDNAPDCALETPVNRVEELINIHATFLNNTGCLQALDLCLPELQNNPPREDDPDGQLPPPPQDRDPEPLPEDDYDDDDCSGEGCSAGLELLCAGAELASACEGDDGGGCEGDSGGSSGCEGDTVEGGGDCCAAAGE